MVPCQRGFILNGRSIGFHPRTQINQYVFSHNSGSESIIFRRIIVIVLFFRCKHQKVQNNELKLNKQHTKNRTQLSGRALKCYTYLVAR